MADQSKNEILGYGVRAYRSRHPEIRKLKRRYVPSAHGIRVWGSSWLVMDFFKRRGLTEGNRILEVGCGWGLAGIYCAKEYGARVTGVDIDSEVFPYLRVHADINDVEMDTMRVGFDGLTGSHLKGFDVIIGADICFWDTLIESLKGLIHRAFDVGVKLVILADPGRSTFMELGDYFTGCMGGIMYDRVLKHPYPIEGKILKIGPLCTPFSENQGT